MSRTISAGYVYRQYSTEGVYLADYKSSREAHEATGVSIGSIARATGVYTRLVDAGKLLMDVINRNQGGANKDLTHFTEQILALCDKWAR